MNLQESEPQSPSRYGLRLYARWLAYFRRANGLSPHRDTIAAFEAQPETARSAWGDLAREIATEEAALVPRSVAEALAEALQEIARGQKDFGPPPDATAMVALAEYRSAYPKETR